MIHFLGLSYYWTYYLLGILLIPGIIFSIYAQAKVTSTYNKYSKSLSESGKTAKDIAEIMLESAGCHDIEVARVEGHLTDNFNPKTKTVSLSDSVYDSSSVAAIGVAAHEIGHVLQHKTNYFPIKLRTLAITTSNLSSTLLWPLLIIGLILNSVVVSTLGNYLIWAGIIMFSLAVVVNLVTLPVEYNASKRATKILQQSGILTREETQEAKAVLNAAALTYVAALVVSILNLLRLVLSIRSSD